MRLSPQAISTASTGIAAICFQVLNVLLCHCLFICQISINKYKFQNKGQILLRYHNNYFHYSKLL